ncbi:hypothetical protein [Synechococcus sp. C9]|uniref:hypothetical protein n=1 Tax=Synechococcus sp. C9 TaxID=102119 RepID=UPI001FF58A1A|nr:hypothetical protein [Synechococcus sp. C9]
MQQWVVVSWLPSPPRGGALFLLLMGNARYATALGLPLERVRFSAQPRVEF